MNAQINDNRNRKIHSTHENALFTAHGLYYYYICHKHADELASTFDHSKLIKKLHLGQTDFYW